jgi:hypothetical protein
MWARLDDELIDHSKVFEAGDVIGGKNGPALALALYAVGLMWANKHLSDGFLPTAVVKSFRHLAKPLFVADALVKVKLWERNGNGGYHIHDFADFNPKAAKVKDKRQKDKLRKQQEREEKEAKEAKRK